MNLQNVTYLALRFRNRDHPGKYSDRLKLPGYGAGYDDGFADAVDEIVELLRLVESSPME